MIGFRVSQTQMYTMIKLKNDMKNIQEMVFGFVSDGGGQLSL